MAEDLEGPEAAGEAQSGADPAAVALALGSASREKADAFLDDQRRMLHLQMEEMRGEFRYKLSHYRLRRFSDWDKAAFEASLGLLALAVVAGLGVMVWNAAHSDGLVLESFSVPPDLVQTGNSGEVLATRLLDKLNKAQDANPTQTRPGRSLSGGWGDDIKVEIPETGVSLGELYSFLRRWLGHEIHVGGDVVRIPTGLAVSVRIDGRDGASFTGPQAELDNMMQKAAEHVFEVIDPARYGGYLATANPPRAAESLAVLERAANDSSLTAQDRQSALNNLAIHHRLQMADEHGAERLFEQAVAVTPDGAIPRSNLVGEEQTLGHVEAEYAAIPGALAAFAAHASEYYPQVVIAFPATIRSQQARLLGDYAEMERQARIALAADRINQQDASRRTIALALAGRHDAAATRDWLAQMPPATQPQDATQRLINRLQTQAALEQWPLVIAAVPAVEKAVENTPPYHYDAVTISTTQIYPWLALAKAKLGGVAGGEAVIATTPGDCYDCARVRGLIASEARQWGRAGYWFARAIHDAPAIPMAHEDWGRSFLARGKPDDAIEQFKLANQESPHFADPLEGWGEALMAKNQSDRAIIKLAEAEKYAPNWGRLHLKWGEALVYAGKPDEAKAQFARAVALDLTPAEKTELAWQHKGGAT